MTKDLQLKVKIKGDKQLYDVTGFQEDDEVNCYDEKTGNHLDFGWEMIQGFTSGNAKKLNP
ncbi:MAG: hypothetical protein V4608_10820 [Bacteroidota bacterium]